MTDRRGESPHPWQSAFLFGVAFFLCAELGSRISVPEFPYVTFWLPAGLYAGALLTQETRRWPGLMLAALPANFLFDLPAGTPWLTTLGFYCANTAEAVTGAWLVRRWVAERPDLGNLREFFGLLVCAGGISACLGTLIGVGTLTASGMSSSFWDSARTWWGSQAVSILLVTPFMLAWLAGPEPKEPLMKGRARWCEAALLAVALTGLAWHILVAGQGINASHKSRLTPLLLWAGLRFGLRGATAANLWLALLTAWLTTHYRKGLTPAEMASGEYVGAIQSFLEVGAFISLVATIVVQDRNRKILELKESEERFRQLTQAAFEGICISEHGRICDINEQGLKMLGYTREEIIGKSIAEMVAPESREAVAEAVRNNREVAYEHRLLRRDGTMFYGEAQAKMVRAGGRMVRMTALRDISGRKAAEAALRQSEERFARMFQSSPIPVTLVRLADGMFLDVNEGFVRMSGFTREEIIGHTVFELKVYPDPGRREVILEQLRAHGKLHGFEQLFRAKSGEIRHHQLWIERIEISGEPCALVLGLDITEQKRAEASVARLAKVVEQTSEAIVITDTDGTITYVNPAFEKTTGYAFAEAAGRNPRLLKSGRQDAAFYKELWDTLKRGEVWRGRFINRRKDGALYEEEATISPLSDGAGKIVSYVAVKRDVTREVQLEMELRQSQKMEAIGQLAGGVAHDFNNILSALLMQTDLIALTSELPPRAREGLQVIRADVDRATALTRQLLLFSRRQVMQMRLLNLNELIMNLGRMLQRVIREDVQLQLRLGAASLTTRADAGMIEQVLMNLAVNARDAMPGGGRLQIETSEIRVDRNEAGWHPEVVAGRYVCLSVGDTGTGIAPEVLPRIFEPFFTTKEAGKGTGLGLATVFGIVKQHKGWISVDNRPGEGVTFHVYLPASDELAHPEPVEAKPKPRGGAETIFIVEDEEALRLLTRRCLERHGYRVIDAANGAEALKRWVECGSAVSLLLTDLVMPGGIDGQELARRLQADRPEIKVIYTSGYSADIAGRDFQTRAGEAFIQKPFATDYLLETIRRSLDG